MSTTQTATNDAVMIRNTTADNLATLLDAVHDAAQEEYTEASDLETSDTAFATMGAVRSVRKVLNEKSGGGDFRLTNRALRAELTDEEYGRLRELLPEVASQMTAETMVSYRPAVRNGAESIPETLKALGEIPAFFDMDDVVDEDVCLPD